MIPSDRQGLLIVIADGARARLVRCAGDNALHTVQEFESDAARERSSGLGTDKPGATMHTGSTAQHAIQPRSDLQQLEKAKFAAVVADAVDTACAREQISGVLLVAPPHALNEVKENLSVAAARKVLGSVAKDLAKVPDHQLQTHLADWIPPIYRPHSHI